MIPVITLIGRPNVGKSTLFNRLTRTRDALVADFPRLTRDRKYGHAEWEGHKFIIIDTGGIDGTEKGVETHMAAQSLVAIEEADVVLFIVDGRSGLMAADQDIAKHLRNRHKATVIVANKTDGIDSDSAVSDFYALGMSEIIPIASSHGHGINSLLQQVLLPLVSNGLPSDDESEARKKKETSFDPIIKIAIVGRPNVGKSTLTNCVLGEERVMVYDIPGTTRDSIYIPMVRDERKYVLIDTAGVRKRSKVIEAVEKISVIKTLQAIEDSNVVVLVIDAHEGMSDQDLSLLSFILDIGRSLVIAVNKWDSLPNEVRNEFKQMLNLRLRFIDFVRVHFISALHDRGVSNLFESVNEAYQCATKRVSTALLTRIMRTAVDRYQPPLARGRRIKPKYAHAGGYNPLIVVIHGTQVKNLPDSYKHYLMNYFRRSLEIMGTPLRIQFNEADNPFTCRRNTLTPTQLHKRKRLMDYIKKNK
ncbi:MAG: 50S ribosomal subunit stability factor [Sodalis sp. Psp]|nr:50S ribosomal subunit stability factor [Sodalis sp. Psp]MCR3757308.1 50S ribosomal subunit stability factor [Sodalis sp. Ppy]